MLTRFANALSRAILMALLVATPAILLPQSTPDTNQIVLLMAIFAGLFTLVEYAGRYPSLVEFRDAPPFNRIRFTALWAIVLILSLIGQGRTETTTLTALLTLIGDIASRAIDFPYSPVRLVVLMMPLDADPAMLDAVRIAAGISYLVSMMAIVVFLLVLWLEAWPPRGTAFNVWVNLPTFDPTAGGDVVQRLRRDAGVNYILGFLLPFVIPAVVRLATDLFDPITLSEPHTLIWTLTAWAFLPASLIMRGIALSHVARMVEAQRRRVFAAAQEDRLTLV